ncbi:growth hormone receptor-like [Periophthalmus magnuspinnatus]|uniref:growth hormone receptor-like n=1 Tax=Periophthalmus magnuspinnatus TaxID=409849 RepID=UPI00145B4C26|nr:growth hormone receptor-like [Periophthalmus magnuspinnatus]
MAFPKSSQILLLSICFTIAASDNTAKPTLPHIVDCFSANMETLRCRWSSGALHNLSEPGALRLFYLNKPSTVNWTECPEYSTKRPDECFFSEAHTTVWASYRVQLRSRDQSTVYDETVFTVYERVRPDPPYNLKWDVLNSSVTGQYYDTVVRWSPPESADVKSGWMKLQYELQHRDTNSDLWKASDLLDTTHSSVFGLHTGIQYEVRLRCKMSGLAFGDFSESMYIYKPSTVSRFPVAALFIFGALCVVAVLMLVIISQQQKLMVLLLPPIPGPKIRGIDPELLKKGKLRELSSILGASELRPELYSADPWVEFIELDLEETADPLTHCLLPGSPRQHRSPDSPGFHDNDSGRASCCDPDLHSDAESSPFHATPEEEPPTPTIPPTLQQAMYTQVSEVRLSGNVVLSPEEETHSHEETHSKHKPENNTTGYTSELNAGKITDVERSRESPTAAMLLLPAPAYTVVEGVDRQNSLLLTPHLLSSKPTPEGYLTPDLFGGMSS